MQGKPDALGTGFKYCPKFVQNCVFNFDAWSLEDMDAR
jgi:hypothetical protein